ncbi:hypothetical protein [Kitasatospora sp. NBC_00458]|uniref:hypothetical protein n=1 Tax=Kitasatospora sp. NBC_00458 TaxID=2903568 RepID=UPI002E170D14
MSKARWTGSLVASAVLLLTGAGAGAAVADTVPAATDGTAIGWRALGLAVSPEGNRAYVVAADRSGSRTPVVLRTVDTRTGAVVAELPLADDGTAGRPVVSQDGRRLYVLVSDRLVAVDTATATVLSRTPAPDQPRPDGWSTGGLTGLAVSPDGSKVYVDQDGPEAYGQGVRPGRVLVFGTPQGAFTASVPLRGHTVSAIALQPGGAGAYVSTDAGLEHLDTTAPVPTVLRTVARIGATKELTASPDGLHLYALGSQADAGTGYVVDTVNDTARPVFTFADGPVDLHYVAVSPDGGRVHVLKGGWTPQASVLSYDTATDTGVPGETLTGFGLDGVSAAAVAPGGHTLYLAGIRGDLSYLKTVRY